MKSVTFVIKKSALIMIITALVGCGGSGGVTVREVDPPPASSPDTSAVLTWDAPTTNDDIDNSCITDHGGYNVYYGEDSANLANLIRNADATCTDTGLDAGTGCGNIFQCTYTVSSLTNGTWYFAVTAYDLAGNESGHSSIDWKVIQ